MRNLRLLFTFTSKDPIESRCLTTSKGPYAYCSLILCPHRFSKCISSEFVFLVDCSGSISGQSIQKAGECLEFFIKSLPADCYFNIIRFGSNFEPLFTSSERYCQTNVEKAIDLAQNLKDDLGGTGIYEPLQYIFDAENPFGQRQVFILTDGEVWDRSSIIELVSNHSNNNRCFTVGLGRRCDGGLVEGIANASGGKCAFVQEGDLITQTIIPQLQSSLHHGL